MTRTCDVVVVGGGVIGAAIARRLAPNRDVVVLERGQIAGEASGLAAGNIRPTMTYASEPTIAEYANRFFREYDGTDEFEFVKRPRIELIHERQRPGAEEHVRSLGEQGFPVSMLDRETVERRWPSFDLDRFVGAVEYRDTGFVDPYTFTVTLSEDATRRGAEFRLGVTATDVIRDGNELGGVVTDDEPVHAETVVVAAGWRSRQLLEPVLPIPVRPYFTQIIVLRPPDGFGETFPIGRDTTAGIYFRPERNGDLLVGGGRRWTESPERHSSGANTDEGFRLDAIENVTGYLPVMNDSQLVNGWAGVDGVTPDKRPIIDAPTDGPDGLVVATGFSGGGIKDAPVAAAVVDSYVNDEPCPFPREYFALERLDTCDIDFPLKTKHALY